MPVRLAVILILPLLLVAGYFLFPYLFFQIVLWQREINQLLSQSLQQIQQQGALAGLWLVGLSFAYGVLHAVGPGHGKFVIASYLSTHSSKFNATIRLTLLSALTQGLVAIGATSVIVVLLNLSSRYFKLSQLVLECGAFVLLFLLGLRWCYQGIKKWRGTGIKIKKMTALKVPVERIGQSAVVFSSDLSCDCGHQHLPTAQQLAQSTDYKNQILLILTIGMRPCSGAIFVLFLAYMLDLYLWGVFATLAMSVGTGLTLSGFGLLVRYARNTALNLGRWYDFSKKGKQHIDMMVKFAAGGILMFLALSLLYGTLLSQSSRAVF